MVEIFKSIFQKKKIFTNRIPLMVYPENYQVGILLGGQSNMLGNVNNAPPAYLRKKIRKAFIYNQGKWEVLKYKKNQQSFKKRTFGPELSLAYQLVENTDREIYLAKHSVSSAPLYDDPQRKNFSLSSYNEYEKLKTVGLQLRQKIESIGKTPIIIMVWIQGEGDVASENGAANYFQNFSCLYNELNADGIGINFTILNQLKIGHRWNSQPDILHRYHQVRKQQAEWCTHNPNSFLLKMDQFDFGADELHFSSQSQIKIGAELSVIISNYVNSQFQ